MGGGVVKVLNLWHVECLVNIYRSGNCHAHVLASPCMRTAAGCRISAAITRSVKLHLSFGDWCVDLEKRLKGYCFMTANMKKQIFSCRFWIMLSIPFWCLQLWWDMQELGRRHRLMNRRARWIVRWIARLGVWWRGVWWSARHVGCLEEDEVVSESDRVVEAVPV